MAVVDRLVDNFCQGVACCGCGGGNPGRREYALSRRGGVGGLKADITIYGAGK